ncbi:sigma-54-dependent Fis family transcriptional regulator [Erythrobacter sp. HL-111]|uniref:sigma-54 interaction domain-containing protein n=1 Tax=Erythrobacter sp. HL-111 TaxID=1798193 RepID=UPI0006D98B33|nr:sigma 54-interacting transcriptional regulator [Erythrobacter sp. HL-111]KPP92576.1 MAG: two-component system, response regulator FlrC [Erythrobacteraceae bacterium HL-111]SDS92755.1 two-component system, response regulator FlrC [Erythrobacter sp. HL-111]
MSEPRHHDFPVSDPAARGTAPNPRPAAPHHDVAGFERVRARHAALLEATLPLLGKDWQQGRIVLGEDGRFACPPGGRRADRVEIELAHADAGALAALGKTRLALAYDPSAPEAACAAMLAAAGRGGWPVAGDEHSLALLTLAERLAASDIPVLLEGPTGTGKEVLARFVHRRSPRAAGPFVAVNCAAMPEAMLEGLLFGHRKGAFTGAAEAREGLFRAADGGTLLLDEIGELPLALQAKLLRALQEGEVLPLGATEAVGVDVRIVAATNRTLSAEVAAGRFREDLLYRLNVFPLALAPLAVRRGDIAPLAFAMLLRHAPRANAGARWIEPDALRLLEAHGWPGNVRELENVMRRALLLAGDARAIAAEHVVFDQPVRAVLPAAGAPACPDARARRSLSEVAFESEARAILAALDSHGGHRARTAASLGISERTLRYRLASMRESGLIAAGGEA